MGGRELTVGEVGETQLDFEMQTQRYTGETRVVDIRYADDGGIGRTSDLSKRKGEKGVKGKEATGAPQDGRSMMLQ